MSAEVDTTPATPDHPTGDSTGGAIGQGMHARRWIVLLSIALSALIVSLDTSLLSVAIPTVMKEFDATLSSVQWVLTGYSLVFASLLVIGGRLGDLHGHRKTFAIGSAMFAVGSLVATFSWSVPSLFVGEALIEGVGACLMLPAAMALISTGFQGRDRATAFSMLGAAVGVGTALGPLLGGFFTSELTWRLGFGINVIIAPCAVVGILAFLPTTDRDTAAARPRLDIAGALLLASGMFLLVFALSEGGTYGWWTPLGSFTVGSITLWPDSLGVSATPVVILIAVALLATFVMVERRKERTARDPLIELSGLRHRRFRYGLFTTAILAMGQLGLIVVLSVFLQSAARLRAVEVGVWLIPMGVSIIVGSRLGAISANRFDTVVTVRAGLVLEILGLGIVIAMIAPGITFLELASGLVLYGLGIGAASAQLVNVILSDVDPTKAGVAGGTNSTVRQVGAALGIATISTILTGQSVNHTVDNIRATGLPESVQSGAISAIDRLGTSFTPAPGTSPTDAATLLNALAEGIASAARPALLFGLGTLFVGLGLSFLMPRPGRRDVRRTDRDPRHEHREDLIETEPLGEIPLDRQRGLER